MKRLKAILFLTLVTSLNICAQDNIVSSTGPSDSNELITFVDQWLADKQKEDNTPALTISLVQNGQVQISKGYGVANTNNGQRVDANSIFRIASVSKVFVGIAAAQLVEQGKLDLNLDINDYLDIFKIDNPFKQPVTLQHLLSHTAGFDEQIWSDLTLDKQDRQTLGEHLAQMMPPVVNPPGEMLSYSNYGYSLAAYIIERITGMSFDQYVNNNILIPLKMNSSGYFSNDNIKQNLVTGYKGEGENLTTRPYTYVHRYPSTSMMSSANDMVQIMNAVLNKGKTETGQIYASKADQLITKTLYSADVSMPGQTAGFMQWNRWEHKIIWHDGGHVGFAAELMLFPELNSGFFIAVNKKNSSLASELKYALLNRYYKPTQLKKLQAPYIELTDHSKILGDYVYSRRSHNSLAKIFSLLESPLTITQGDNGLIHAFGLPFAEESPNLFAYVERPDMKLKIVRDNSNQINYVALDYFGAPRSYEKMVGFDNLMLHKLILISTLTIFIIWTVMLLVMRFKKANKGRVYIGVRQFSIPTALNLLFSILFLARLATIDSMRVRMGDTPELWLLLCIPLITLGLVIWKSYQSIGLFKDKQLGLASRIMLLVGLLANIMFLVELHYWNLLGFHFIS
ncbi:serine hydrolase domain-containing protein [Colwelliaceae bacterium 6471]